MTESFAATGVAATFTVSAAPPPDVLESFTGAERILAVIPFVADISTTPRWHHLLFTQDKVLAVPALPEPAVEADSLFSPPRSSLADRYPSVRAALRLVAIPQPLTPAHVTAVIPYALVRNARLVRGRGTHTPPELVIRTGRRTSWWFFRKGADAPDLEKTGYALDLLLALLPFPVELEGFSEVPRPPQPRLRRGLRNPLPTSTAGGSRPSADIRPHDDAFRSSENGSGRSSPHSDRKG